MWNSTNITSESDGKSASHITLVTSLTVVGVLTLSANIVLLITLLRFSSKHLKQSTRFFLIYKCLGHVFQGLSIMARPHILYAHCVHFGRVSRLVLGMVVGGMFLLSLDSFITITKPYSHNFIMTPRMAKLSIFLFCLLLVILLVISVFVPAPAPTHLALCTQNNSQIDPWVLLMMNILGIFFIFMAISLQAFNIWTLWKRFSIVSPPAAAFPVGAIEPNAVQPSPNQPPNNTNNARVTRLYRLQRLLTVWVISGFICWLPSVTIVSSRAIMDICSITESPVLLLVQPFFTVLPLVDGILQPCLAVALSQELRSAVQKLFCCGKCKNGVSMAVVDNGVVGGGNGNDGVCAVSHM